MLMSVVRQFLDELAVRYLATSTRRDHVFQFFFQGR